MPDIKLATVEMFCDEINPILESLNSVLTKYKLSKEIISFNWKEGKVVPFVSYDTFPSSVTKKGATL